MIIRPKYLGDYKGELCVIDEDSLSNEPKMLVLYIYIIYTNYYAWGRHTPHKR